MCLIRRLMEYYEIGKRHLYVVFIGLERHIDKVFMEMLGEERCPTCIYLGY